MKFIYSKEEPTKLLHIVYRREDFRKERVDIVPEDQFIQASALKLNKGKTFKPHKHIWKSGQLTVIAQESWCVISGKVKVIFYDLNDEVLTETILNPGDISITLQGGHTYEILENDSIIYEYKTGPYEGQNKDKVFL